MGIKITSSFPKAFEFLNGLLPHAEEIAQYEFDAGEDDCWEGIAVVVLQANKASRMSMSGELVPELRIHRIELMQGQREEAARRLLDDRYKERSTSGTLLDPEVVGDEADDLPMFDPFGPPPAKPVDRHQGGLRSAQARAASKWAAGNDAS